MSRKEFRRLLALSSDQAWQFGQQYVIEQLPPDFRYDIHLNQSLDSPDLEQFDVYPEDEGKVWTDQSQEQVLDVILRQGKVPVWIDISVERIRNGKTVLQLRCAGRYSQDPEEYYYHGGGTGPFGIKSPVFPPGVETGERFRLRSQWWRKSRIYRKWQLLQLKRKPIRR